LRHRRVPIRELAVNGGSELFPCDCAQRFSLIVCHQMVHGVSQLLQVTHFALEILSK
jgi:hypothetical protein